MIQSFFTDTELFCMAYLMRKRKLYGIPVLLSPEQKAQIQNGIDRLLDQKLAKMDMDGNISLCPEYHGLIDTISDCRKCLAVNVQKEDRSVQSLVFWKYNGKLLMAEAEGSRYIFAAAEESMVQAMLDGVQYRGKSECAGSEAVIPHRQMIKAKRLCQNNNISEAIRVLRQNGASEEIACVLTDGMLENGYVLNLQYMDMQNGDCKIANNVYLAGRDILLRMGETMINLHRCATFTAVELQQMQTDVARCRDSFLKEGAEYVG